MLADHTIVKFTDKTHETISALESDLKRCRERGYAFDSEEAIIGIRCVGAPIFDHTGKVVAGISIAAPAFRMDKKKHSLHAQLITKTATLISNDLGKH